MHQIVPVMSGLVKNGSLLTDSDHLQMALPTIDAAIILTESVGVGFL
tara:strand:+ start:37 stop:177 length:141 start_codon:yes stop_codon:yes gene_type:complete